MGVSFSLHFFFFASPLHSLKAVESMLIIFLTTEGKLAIYKTRKAKLLLANPDAVCNVLVVFKALIMPWLHIEFNYYQTSDNLETF